MSKYYLEDVAIIRPFAILCIVIGHSFAVYSGAWAQPAWLNNVQLYKWINPFFISFQLQAFVFIAGYVYAFQTMHLRKEFSILSFVGKKIQRIIVPSIFFSVLYFFLFMYKDTTFDFFSFGYSILNGTGHLWFLPMIFWCYVLIRIFEPIIKNRSIPIILIGMIVLSLFSFVIPDLFRFSSTCNYLLYFYLGYLTWQKRNVIISKLANVKWMTVGLFLFFILFFLKTKIVEYLSGFQVEKYSIENVMHATTISAIQIFIGIVGIYELFLVVNYFLEIKKVSITKFIIESNKVCYGIYIYQQFILIYLLWYNPYAHDVNFLCLPFLILLITLVASFVLTKLTMKVKFGRYLIG